MSEPGQADVWYGQDGVVEGKPVEGWGGEVGPGVARNDEMGPCNEFYTWSAR